MVHTPESPCTRRCNHFCQHVPTLGCTSQALPLGASTAWCSQETCLECSCPDAMPALDNSLEAHRHPCGLVHPLPAGLSGCVIVFSSAWSLPPVSASTFPCQKGFASFNIVQLLPGASTSSTRSSCTGRLQELEQHPKGHSHCPRESAESAGETQRPGVQRNVCPRRGTARSEISQGRFEVQAAQAEWLPEAALIAAFSSHLPSIRANGLLAAGRIQGSSC